MEKKAKIIATLGPAIYSEYKLTQLVNLGVDAFRINFSHNTTGIEKIISKIRKIERFTNKKIALIADLQGIKLRIGKIKNDSQKIKYNQKFIFDTKKDVGNNIRINFPYPKVLKKLNKGNKILLDDGKFTFIVLEKKGSSIITICKSQNCFLKSNKSVHIQNFDITSNKLTLKDRKDIQTAIKFGCNWIALSYLQNEKIIFETRKLITNDMGIISKIENKHALKNINKIIKASDSIMIARGDLAIDIGHSEVPKVQLSLIKKCSQFSKSVIVATQMLESMINSKTPTRAESNDVANAVLDGADAVMLSAESATGNYPLLAVESMERIITSVEKTSNEIYFKFEKRKKLKDRLSESLINVACRLSDQISAKALVTMTKSGYSAYRVSGSRPKAKIYIVTNDKKTGNELNLLWGVRAIYYDKTENIDNTFENIEKILVNSGHLSKNDKYIITSSMPTHWKGHTNMMKINVVDL